MKRIIAQHAVLIFAFCMLHFASSAQDRTLVLDGNNFYNQQKFKEAAETYRKALEKTPTSVPASFNLGNALMQQKKYEEARKVMQEAAKVSKDKSVQSGANYNTGNAYMEERKWNDAVEAYKNALRANPKDGDAKYNLSYAQSMLKKEQHQKQQKQQNQDQKKNSQQKQQPQPQPKDGQQKQDQQPQQQQPKPDNNSMTKQQADNLLNALEEEEKKLRDKKQSENGVPTRQAKDW